MLCKKCGDEYVKEHELNIDSEGHCIYCFPTENYDCERCKKEIFSEKFITSTKEECEAFRAGLKEFNKILCQNCLIETQRDIKNRERTPKLFAF